MNSLKKMRLTSENPPQESFISKVYKHQTPINVTRMSELDQEIDTLLNQDIDENLKAKLYADSLRRFLTVKKAKLHDEIVERDKQVKGLHALLMKEGEKKKKRQQQLLKRKQLIAQKSKILSDAKKKIVDAIKSGTKKKTSKSTETEETPSTSKAKAPKKPKKTELVKEALQMKDVIRDWETYKDSKPSSEKSDIPVIEFD